MSWPAAFAQSSQPVITAATKRADDSKSRRELAADLVTANKLIADLESSFAKTNAVLDHCRENLDKAEADLANLQGALKKANDDLANANAELKSVKGAKVSIAFYNGANFRNTKDFFHYEYTVEQLLADTQRISDICHVEWENKSGWSDHDDGIPRSVTINVRK